VEVSYLPRVLVRGTLKYLDIQRSNLNSTQTQTVATVATSEGLKSLAGVCLFKSFGNYTVVSGVRLHHS
jgi:hypothetical protein